MPRRQWNGFPSGIETDYTTIMQYDIEPVASGMASRQGLKQKLKGDRYVG